MCECNLRVMALEMASDLGSKGHWSVGQIVEAAERFYEFLDKCDCEEIPQGEVR